MNVINLQTGVQLLDPEQVADLVKALFALSYAIEQLGLVDPVNSYREVSTDVGAWDFAYCMLRNLDAIAEACEAAPEA